MACLYPRAAYWTRDKDGKRGVAFRSNAPNVISGSPFRVPCGQCVQCRLAHSRTWAVRCMHEYRMWYNQGYDGSFVTLTYDDKALLKVTEEHGCPTLVKRDLQLFMKRLRKETGNGVRFYACGEYGSRTNRPHYHLLLFNRDFSDKRFYGNSGSGEALFSSELLRRLWPAGNNIIGGLSFKSCAYVSRYVVDKITGDRAADHYGGFLPEFSVMSRRPGIGKSFFDRYRDQLYRDDKTVLEGREIGLPRFYDVEYEKLDKDGMEELKKTRRRRAMLLRDRSEENNPRRRAKEVFELKKLAVFQRKAV